MRELHVHLEKQEWGGTLALYVVEELRDTGRRRYYMPGEIVELAESDSIIPGRRPTLELGNFHNRYADTAGQQLIDQLWTLGYRPSKALASTGALEAQQQRAEDLKGVTHRLLDLMGPNVTTRVVK